MVPRISLAPDRPTALVDELIAVALGALARRATLLVVVDAARTRKRLLQRARAGRRGALGNGTRRRRLRAAGRCA